MHHGLDLESSDEEPTPWDQSRKATEGQVMVVP